MDDLSPALAGIVTALVENLTPEALAALADDPLVGAVAVDDRALPGLRGSTLPLTLVATGGAAQVDGPLRLAARLDLRVAGVRTTVRDPGDPAGAVRRVLTALDQARAEGLLDDEVPVTLVLPAGIGDHGAGAALDEVAAAELRAGLAADDPAAWVRLVDAALDREVPVETVGAGAPPPLVVLAATRACLDGEPEAAERLLRAADAGAAGAAYDVATLERTRRWCPRVDARR
ncbi:hypothetical protein ACOACO_06660 [Nocardioides sp. CPCC 205120]|uniref:hypothetical protein n=1 Tax=Nocardioides sp. CPCC 205120 TaxID=3406462 RepID=UPI003B50E760